MPTQSRTWTDLQLDENTRAAFDWTEQQLGARIESAYLQPRWARKQWFLDLVRPDGEPVKVVLRGRKSEAFGPGARTGDGGTALSSTAWNSPASRLAREAAVLRALQDRP